MKSPHQVLLAVASVAIISVLSACSSMHGSTGSNKTGKDLSNLCYEPDLVFNATWKAHVSMPASASGSGAAYLGDSEKLVRYYRSAYPIVLNDLSKDYKLHACNAKDVDSPRLKMTPAGTTVFVGKSTSVWFDISIIEKGETIWRAEFSAGENSMPGGKHPPENAGPNLKEFLLKVAGLGWISHK